MLITYPKIDRLQKRLDEACGLIQKALTMGLITSSINQDLHKQALCYAGLLQDINQGSADTENPGIQGMFECIETFCSTIESELKERVAA